VRSVPGQGATFVVELRRESRARERVEPDTAQPQKEPKTRTAPGTLSVLLVDDEEGLRRAVMRFLERHGMRVVAVGDGNDALQKLQHDRFDVIVSDVRMPGMSGGEFLEQLRRHHPAMVHRLVFTTGDSFATDTAALLRDSGLPALVKPYDFASLERKLREVVNSAA
jgi:CheY-like chemotaxis protein